MTEPPIPPGWQRRQDLIDRLADIQFEVDGIRRMLPSVNDPDLRLRIEDLLAVASELVTAHGTNPGPDVAEALAGLQSATSILHVPPSDPEFGVTSTQRILRSAHRRLGAATDDALAAAKSAEHVPLDIPVQRENTGNLPRAAMLARLDEVLARLDVIEAARAEPTTVVQQTGLLNFYVPKMRVQVDLARITLTIGDKIFDFGALTRTAEAMADLTADYVETIRVWARVFAGRLSPTVVETAKTIGASVRRAVAGIRKLGRLIERRAASRPGNVAAAAAAVQSTIAVPEVVWIPPGRFMRGVPDEEEEHEQLPKALRGQAKPRREVTFRQGFWLGRYPVTRGEFAAFVAATDHDMSGGAYGYVDGKGWEQSEALDWRNPGFAQTDRHPVVCVSFDDATEYLKWLSRETGLAWRLPSEAEWEYAARAGTSTTRYWGDDWSPAAEYAQVEAAGTGSVGSKKPNGFGLHDMLGNVWEWTADPWHDSYDGAPSDGSVWTTGGRAGLRVLRGGSWKGIPRNGRAGARSRDGTGYRHNITGFRVARTL
jgi:formylglycine-generating enzyme required for sulfatase activity